ncbi:MAG: tetratricopeptide repeat protein [Deltaproteobacteria bacterium]|nr:tetratricopeptide repeat protein [Deltaproteobacteria bacterium]
MDEKSKIIDKAQKLVQKGYLDKAIAEYKRALEKDPKDATIRLRIGDLYVKVNKRDEAIREYGEVAKLHAQKGFYLKAIAVYKQILKLDEGLMEIHFKLADLYTKQKLIADAIAELSILVSFYEKKGKFDEAFDVLKKMIEADPQNIGVRLKVSEYYQKRGFTKDALAEYTVVFKSLVKDGKLEKAEKLYQGLYADNRQNIDIVEGLAEVYRLKGDNNQLVRYYKELAKLYKEKGEVDKRKEIYEKILALYPDDKDALDAIGRKSVVQEAAKKVTSVERIPEEEPLISWPEVSVDLTSELKAAPEEPSAVKTEEEPLIPWKEMIEVVQEAKPVEAKDAKQIEDVLLIEMPEISAAKAAAKKEKREAVPLIDIKEPTSHEEHAPEGFNQGQAHVEEIVEELSHEYIESVEELPVVEKIEASKVVKEPAKSHGLEGLEEFMPEGSRVMGELESSPEEGYVDLSLELGLEEALGFLTESWTSGSEGKETLTEFKQGVEKQLSKENSETHYNLGIAYMEMELYNDAMREFKIALKDPSFEFDCYNRLGLSSMAKGNYQEAISNFLKGLKVGGRSDEERKGLMYELGLAYEASGNSHEAVEVFKSVYETDKTFREVASKVNRLIKKTKKGDETEAIPSRDNMIEIELL